MPASDPGRAAVTPADAAGALPASDLRRVHDLVHQVLVVLLLVLVPLVWDGDPAALDHLAWLTLLVIGLLLGWLGSLAGWLTWRCNRSGVALMALVLLMVPAVIAGPSALVAGAMWSKALAAGALAAYLALVLPGRERLALAAVVAGAGAQIAIALLQWPWVLPAMRSAQAAGDITLGAAMQGDLIQRLHDGGIFGTFTLANQLAAYLVLLLPLLFGLLVAKGQRRGHRLVLGILLVGGVIAMLGANAKAGWLSLAMASTVAWLAWMPGRWRWLPLPCLALGIAALLASAGLRAAFWPSIEVRLGYWSGATELVRQAPLLGHGLGGFSAEYPSVMPLWAEPVRFAHCEPLELAVDAGLPAGLLLLGLLAALAWGRRAVLIAETPVGYRPPPALLVPMVLVVAFAYGGLFGLLDGNCGWWPGGQDPLIRVAWVAVVGVLVAALVWRLRDLVPPPAWALPVGLGGFALHCLVDFHLHTLALAGTAVALSCLGARGLRPWPDRWGIGVVIMSMTLLLGLVLWGLTEVRAARSLRDLVQAAVTAPPDRARRALELLAEDLGRPAPNNDQDGRLVLALAVAEARLRGRWDLDLQLQMLQADPPGAAREPLSRALCMAIPHSSFARSQLANDLVAQRRWDDALVAQREAIAREPVALAPRRRFIAIAEQAAAGSAAPERYRAQVEAERAELVRREPMTNSRLR